MRPPTILDIVQAVTEVAPSHPEVAVWWYARADVTGSLPVLVLEARYDAHPDMGSIGSELAGRFGREAIAVRMHRGAGEVPTLYRLLTAADASAAAGHAEGW